MKILFMGTPEFSVAIVNSLATVHNIVGVVTQPDKPVGRKRQMIPSPVKLWAIEQGIPVFQPINIKDDFDVLKQLNADIIVTAAYGQFVGMELINHHKWKAINVHASLLPKYRGGAPIHQAIKDGCTETGISIIYMEKKMDAGDILAMQSIPILNSDTGGTIFQKLSELGASLILKVIEELQMGRANPTPQNHKLATYAFNVTKEEELLDFSQEATKVRNHIRAYNPNPGAYTLIDGSIVKIYESKVAPISHNVEYGTVINTTKSSFTVACGNHTALEVLTIKPEGKNTMSVRDYLNGNGKIILNKIEKVGI